MFPDRFTLFRATLSPSMTKPIRMEIVPTAVMRLCNNTCQRLCSPVMTSQHIIIRARSKRWTQTPWIVTRKMASLFGTLLFRLLAHSQMLMRCARMYSVYLVMCSYVFGISRHVLVCIRYISFCVRMYLVYIVLCSYVFGVSCFMFVCIRYKIISFCARMCSVYLVMCSCVFGIPRFVFVCIRYILFNRNYSSNSASSATNSPQWLLPLTVHYMQRLK